MLRQEPAVLIELLDELDANHSPIEVNVALPKFKMECSLDLVGYMQAMGVRCLFEESDADLSGMLQSSILLLFASFSHLYFLILIIIFLLSSSFLSFRQIFRLL